MAGPVQAQPQKRREKPLPDPHPTTGLTGLALHTHSQPLWQQVLPGPGLAPVVGEAEQTAEMQSGRWGGRGATVAGTALEQVDYYHVSELCLWCVSQNEQHCIKLMQI